MQCRYYFQYLIIMYAVFFHLNHWFLIKYFTLVVFSMLFVFRYIIFRFSIPYFYLKCDRLLWICVRYCFLGWCPVNVLYFYILCPVKCPVFLYFVSCKMSCIFMMACYDHWNIRISKVQRHEAIRAIKERNGSPVAAVN